MHVRTGLSRPSFTQFVEFVGEAEPLTVNTLKAQSKIDFTDEDDLLGLFIAAAREACEKEINAKVRQQRLELHYSAWCGGLRLDGLGKQVVIESIVYVDAAGDEQTLAADQYRLSRGEIFSVVPAGGCTWPTLNASNPLIVLTATAGYADPLDVPKGILYWMVAQAASMYKMRESHSDKALIESSFVDGALDAYRIPIL